MDGDFMARFSRYGGSFSTGIDVVISNHLQHAEIYQYRFPKSRRRRVRKKWAKNKRNYRTRMVGPEIVHMGRTVYATPAAYYKLKQMVNT